MNQNPTYRILAIDDDVEVHDTYQAILGHEDHELGQTFNELMGLIDQSVESPLSSPYRLDAAYSGESGLEMVIRAAESGNPYSVIFLDMRMPPGWDGLKTAEEIRAVDPAIRIILITAYMDYSLSEIRNRIGRDFIFLSKPVNREELLQLTMLFTSQWDRAFRLTKQKDVDINPDANNSIPWGVEVDASSLGEGSSLKILMLEESAAIRKLYGDLLARMSNYQVEMAGNIEQAMSLVEQSTPDITIAGFSFCCDGIEVLAQQLLTGQKPGESLLVFLADKSDVQEVAFIAGAIEVLFKDDPTEIFLQRVAAMERYITTQKQLRASIQLEAQQYLNAAEDARNISKAKDEFLASVSHELRTPLTVIIGNSEALMQSDLSESQRHLLHSVETSARSQLALINDILDMSKIEAGKFDVEEAPYDLHALVDEIHDIFAIRASYRGIEYKTTIRHAFEYQLIGDGQRIGQILINLLGNALKFTSSGFIELAVRVEQEHHLLLSVKDTGIGISAEAQEQLFEPYMQADESIAHRFGGTGLGLHISWTLAELMQGAIEVESEEGSGSTFTLKLPYRISNRKRASLQDDQRGSYLHTSFGGKVLLAEDTPEIQLVVVRLLEAMGIEVTTVENGAEAVEAAGNHPFDLILMDMQMPVMSGVEAATELRRQQVTTPIVALTANVMQKHKEQCDAAGCDGFLTKPIERSELMKILRRFLTENLQTGEEQLSNQSRSQELGRDSVIDKELLTLFFENIEELKNNLQSALDAGDNTLIQGTSHKIKGIGGSCGFPQLTRQAGEICKAIEQGGAKRFPLWCMS